jgi:DNA-binding response OmpR family regulator
VLLLTARREETERVLGLDAGADDYMVKPYSVMELSARIRALLRRAQESRPVDRVVLGPVTLDLATHCAEVSGRAVPLTPKEYSLLEFLVVQSPRTFSREDLLHHVWGSMSDWQDDATVTEHVRRLRSKLNALGCPTDFITTVRGFGYAVSGDRPAPG